MNDEQNRITALHLAVEAHGSDYHGQHTVLETATAYLGWLRKPTPPATLNLRVGPPTEK